MTSQAVSNSQSLFDMLVRANNQRHQTNYQAALALYLEALEQFGENTGLMVSIAHCYFAIALAQQGTDQDCFEAIDWIQKAIALEPTNSNLYADLGQFYSLLIVDYEQAAQAYRQAIKLNPDNIKALAEAAALYGVPEEVVTLTEAIEWLTHTTQLSSDDPNYHARLGDLYHEAGRVADAKREWIKSLLCPQPLDPRHVQAIQAALSASHE